MLTDAGILLINKPAGITSAKVVATIKRTLNVKKIGHAGTLDPMATGLLVILLNTATRLAQYAEGGDKAYSGTIRLGYTSDTDDVEGNLEESAVDLPEFSEVQLAAMKFLGDIEQVPPKVSAVKINGKRAYKRARSGEDFKISPRRVRIDSFEVSVNSGNSIAFKIKCSKGTYIRSIARDLGELLGCGGCLESLKREASEPFSNTDAIALEDLSEASIIAWERMFPGVKKYKVDSATRDRLLVGDSSCIQDIDTSGNLAIYCDSVSDVPLGLLLRDSDSNWKIAVNHLCQV